jgi:ankyrin repeat protein
VQALLAAGAAVTFNDYFSGSALHMAVREQHSAVARLLLPHTATAVINRAVLALCGPDCCGSATVLVLAATLCRDPALLQLLLANGADVHATTASDSTVLHAAVQHSAPVPIICLLIKAGVDLQLVDGLGRTAAQSAADNGNHLIAALLNRAARG